MSLDKSERRIRGMFGQIAGRYDFLNHLLSGGVDYYWRWRTVRAVRPSGDVPVLDVCTGTGDLAIAWWKSGAARVVGADFTHEMLVLADGKRPTAARDGDRPLTFLEADAQRLPFADETFQIVSVAFGLRNVTDTRRGLSEMLRVCRPNGHVMILEFSLPSSRILRSMYLWYFRNVLPRIGQLLARNRESAYDYLPASVSEFPYGEALAEILREVGLADVRWTPLTFGIATLYIGRKPDAASDAVARRIRDRRRGLMTETASMNDLVLAITGASGSIYAVRLLQVLLAVGRNVHLTISPAATLVLEQELGIRIDLDRFDPSTLLPTDADLQADDRLGDLVRQGGTALSSVLSDSVVSPGQLTYHHCRDFKSGIASGSFLTGGMVICPCSMGTIGSLAHGLSTNLIHRAAGVHLKERRKLIVVPRETPLDAIQLGNLTRLAEVGVVVLPAMPGFYHGPLTIHDLVDFVVGRICDQLGIEHALFRRWGA